MTVTRQEASGLMPGQSASDTAGKEGDDCAGESGHVGLQATGMSLEKLVGWGLLLRTTRAQAQPHA